MPLKCLVPALLAVSAAAPGADLPQAEIANGQIRAKIYLPDAANGFYRGTRFDWSGVIYSLQYKGHNYYGPWFQRTDPKVYDFVYEGPDIVAGPCSATAGPVNEFAVVGWNEAKPGGTFLKIGVGALRRQNEPKYDNYHLYEIAVPGKWSVRKGSDLIEFIQELTDPGSGYGYLYRKTLRLVKGKPEMIMEHHLRNTGSRAFRTSVYNHNFLVLDRRPPGPGLTITLPFAIRSLRPPDPKLAEVRADKIVYLKTLTDRDVVATPIQGFGNTFGDHSIRIEDTRSGAGMSVKADRPLLREALWSIRSVVSVEPFIAIALDPGEVFTWTNTYTYYTLPARKK
jgi:hypothetical protein